MYGFDFAHHDIEFSALALGNINQCWLLNKGDALHDDFGGLKTIQNNIGQNKMVIENLNNLNAGIYFTYLKSKNGNSKSIKLIKN